MKVEIVTLFPQFFDGIFTQSIMQRACDADILDIKLHNLRNYTYDRHHQADDYRFGGGAGMLLKPEPFFRVFDKIISGVHPRPLVIFPTPRGEIFDQKAADALSLENHLIFLCGHYKGVDHRVVERWVDREYSVGDYVLTGGELASAVMIDAIVRMIPEVLGNLDSALTDSFRDNLLDCPHYTRPEEVEGMRIPEVLLNGHHKNINLWRRSMSKLITKKRRSDLIKNHG